MPEVRHPFTRDRQAGRVKIDFTDAVPRTKQSFKDECDINRIMHKYQKTGMITHLAKHAPQYGEASSTDLLEAMNTLTKAQEMYDELPSSVRRKFTGPVNFLEFIEDESNAEEIYKLGLAVRQPAAEPLLVRVQPEPDADPAPEPVE